MILHLCHKALCLLDVHEENVAAELLMHYYNVFNDQALWLHHWLCAALSADAGAGGSFQTVFNSH